MADMFELGMNAKMYRNTATGPTAWATPTWSEVKCVRDLTLAVGNEEGDGTTRGSNGIRQSEPTLKAVSVDFNFLWDKTDANALALWEAAWDKTPIDLMILDEDKATVGARGVRAEMKIFDFSRAEPLGDLQTFDASVKPCRSANPVEKVEIEEEE